MRIVAVFCEKATQLVFESCPRGLALEQDVVFAFERHEPRIRDMHRQLSTFIERCDRIVRRMKYEHWRFDQRQQLGDIDRRRGGQKS
jgi:hypothetical protein